MKKILLLLAVLNGMLLSAQKKSTTAVTKPAEKTEKVKKDWSKIDLSNRPADHFVFQMGFDSWTNKPDSIKTKGLGRHFNMYFMLDKPFKNNQKMSLGFGAGFSTSNIYFENTYIDIKANAPKLNFRNVSAADHFSKYKLTTVFLEAPVELRYYSNPENPNKSWKIAVGGKVGTIFKAYTKGKNLVNASGQSLFGNKYMAKEYDRKFFNGTRIALGARVGYGIWSIHASYQLTKTIKDGFGPEVRPFSIGLTISGL